MTRANEISQQKALGVFNPQGDSDLQALAEQLCLPITNDSARQNGLYLCRENNRLRLKMINEAEAFYIEVDFCAEDILHRLRHGHGKHQPLAKAIGLNKHSSLSVVDATAGLGRDAFMLASLGCKVQMLERSPVITSLLVDGINRGSDEPLVSVYLHNMHLLNIVAEEYLSAHKNAHDVVYLDPMFPERKKSAKVKKQMQILQNLLGHQEDSPALLDAALQSAKKRVVVKRPKGAAAYCNSPPTHIIESKKMRYDVYMCT